MHYYFILILYNYHNNDSLKKFKPCCNQVDIGNSEADVTHGADDGC